jgi:hypothetical protein
MNPNAYRQRFGQGTGTDRFGTVGWLGGRNYNSREDGSQTDDGVPYADESNWEMYDFNNGDAGVQQGRRLRPEVQARLMRNAQGQIDPNGMRWTQLGPNGVRDERFVIDDPEFGLITDERNAKAREEDWWDQYGFTIMSLALGGIMAPAMAAGNAATGVSAGAAAAGRGVYGLGRAALQQSGTDSPRSTPSYGGRDLLSAAQGNGMPQNQLIRSPYDDPQNFTGELQGNPAYPNSNNPLGDPRINWEGGPGSDLWSSIGQFGLGALGGYRGNQLNRDYSSDIERMLQIGTAGVTNDDRAGARNMVRGVYDGSISGEDVFNKVPGLKAISERGYNDIARKMSAGGDADPQSSARLREFADYNNELTSKAWNSEMDRASRIGGFNFDPSNMAGRGLGALATLDQNRRNESSGNLALGNRLMEGLFGKNGILGGGGSGAGPLSGLLRLFQGGGITDAEIEQWTQGLPEWTGLDEFGNMPSWDEFDGTLDPSIFDGADNPYDIWGAGP